MRVLLLLISASLCFAADPFDGWGKVKWGASADQIKDAYKAEGVTDALELPKYDIGEDFYAVKFSMEADGLAFVELRPAQGDYVSTAFSQKGKDDIIRLINLNRQSIRISHLLEEKYGPPSKNLSKISDISEIFMEWYLDGGSIRLKFLPDAGGKNLVYKLRLRYERKNKALDKI